MIQNALTPLRYATRSSSLIMRTSPHFRSSYSTARSFASSPAEAASPEVDSGKPFSSPKVESLYDKIVTLPEEEVNILGAMVIQLLGRKIFPGEFGGAGTVAAQGQEAGVVEEVQEAKTIFDLKLVGYDAKAKIKVIKEVRAMAGLGLKEAKELVEAAPKVVQKDLKADKAEELKAQLEAVGAQVEVV
eukprot:scaffold818_cov136-Cylindrotheca_fusiformis.AAC.29